MKTFALIFFLLFTSTLSLYAQIPNYIPTNGLVGWWPFNGNANDESGNGNNGTVNGPTLTTDRFGVANKAYSFDGINDFIQMLYAGPAGNVSVTVSFWIKTTMTVNTSASGGVGYVFSYGANNVSQMGQSFNISVNGSAWVNSCNQSITFDTYGAALAKTVTHANTWDFYTIVNDPQFGSNVINQKIYKNGILLTQTCFSSPGVPVNNTNFSSATPIRIGKYFGTACANCQQSTENHFNGLIDDIGIWNVALTPQEITALYTSTPISTISVNPPSTTICEGSSTTLTATPIGSTPCSSTQLPTNLQSGLVGYWPFCGNANDASFNGNNGSVNGATLTTDRFGNANSAYNFNGTSSYIDVVHSSSLNLTNAYTVAFWVNNLNNTGGWYSTVSKDNWFANQGFINYIAATNFASVNCAASNHATTTLPINTWVQIIVTYENGTLKVYKDGILVASENQAFSNSTSSLRFGARHQNDGSGIVNFFQGKLDDIAMWNRALTASEIQQLYSSGNATYVWTPGGATTPSITVSPATTTTYTCTATSNGISSSATSTVTVNPTPLANAGADSTITCNQYVNGYQLGWYPEVGNSYSWSPTTGLSNANIANPIANPSVTTTYTLTVTNSFGCTATDQATATVNTTISAITVSPNVTICQGSSATIYHNPLPAGSYWVGGWQTWAQDTIVVTPATVGQHTYTCYSANGCSSASVVVTVVASPIVNPVQDQVICSGTPTQSIVFNGTTGSNYTWTAVINPGITGLPYTGIGNIPSYILYNNSFSPQNVSIVVTPSLQQGNMTCQGSPEVFTITVLPIPMLFPQNDITICCQANPMIMLTANMPATFNWFATSNSNFVSGYPSSMINSNFISFTPVNNDSITHQINITVLPTSLWGGCIGPTQTITINVLPCLTVDSVPNIERCNGEHLNEIVFSGNSNSFNWVNSNINNGLAITGIGNIPDMIVNNPGNTSISSQITVSPYYIWQGMSCTGAAETFNLTIHPTPNIDAGNDVLLCNNNALSLSAIGSPNSTIIWNGNLPNGSLIYPTQSGFQTVEATYPNGCSSSDSILVTIIEQSSSNITQTACDQLTINGEVFMQSGIYTQVIPNAAGCDSTITLNLTLNNSPTTPIVYVQNETQLSTDLSQDLSYQWILCSDQSPISNQTNAAFNPTVNGNYAVIVSNSCGSDTSDCIDVNSIGLNEFNQQTIELYPNPNNGYFNVSVPSALIGVKIEIRDINGRILRTFIANEEWQEINISDLASGNYWLAIEKNKPIQMIKN